MLIQYMTKIYNKYLIIKKLLTKITEKSIARILKYRSIKYFIGSPNFQINALSKIKRADLLIMDEIKNKLKLILNAPADIVKTLNGTGVKPDTKIIQKFHSSYLSLIS